MIVNSIPDGITFEQFMGAHSSYPRNRLIARVFYLAGFIESWGRGIDKIRDEFVANGLEAPVYKEEMGGMSVYITRRKGLFGGNDGVNDTDDTVNDHIKSTDNKKIVLKNDGVNDTDGTVNGTVKQILQLIDKNVFITYEELALETKLSRRTIARHIKTMSELFLIVREGSDKSGHWYVTEKGKRILNKE